MSTDTIAAVATASGRGGVGIIRISGSETKINQVIDQVLQGQRPALRYAQYGAFHDTDGAVLDYGLSLLFAAPHSYTGEWVLELQGHGGPVVLDLLMRSILALGVRQARPGEFSERAFLNNKLDLTQAEAVADLIDASSEQAARAALRSLQGRFAEQVTAVIDALIETRIYVEAAIDFSEEEIDFLADPALQEKLEACQRLLIEVRSQAGHGRLLREGLTIVLAGRPNAGKSSLFNALTGQLSAIVTDIAGTTRDTLREAIQIDGVPVNIVDTAGLRFSDDVVESAGIARAFSELKQADHILLLVDIDQAADCNLKALWPHEVGAMPNTSSITLLRNKIDRKAFGSQEVRAPQQFQHGDYSVIDLSAKTGAGMDLLVEHLKAIIGLDTTTEGQFSARRRHLDALERADEALQQAEQQFRQTKALELLAEDLRRVQLMLAEISGEFSSDDLLGRIFGQFCIGK